MRNRVLSGAIGALLAVTGLATGAGSAQAATTGCRTADYPAAEASGLTVNRLDSGQSLNSPDGTQTNQGGVPGQSSVTKLVMQPDGNLVIYLLTQTGARGPAIWNSGTYGHPGAHAIAQPDGNFVVYGTDGTALWNSQTWGTKGGARLLATGELFVGGVDTDVIWSSFTRQLPSEWCPASVVSLPGESPIRFGSMSTGMWLQSANAWLVMQYDGNAVIYRKSDGAPIWNSGTAGARGSLGTYMSMQSDGNLVIYSGQTTLAATGTYGNPGAYALFQTDGNFVVYKKDGGPGTGGALWSTGTWQSANQ